jgi:hypothetical protein
MAIWTFTEMISKQTFFNATTNYYSRKAQTLNKECSDHDYMLKVSIWILIFYDASVD